MLTTISSIIILFLSIIYFIRTLLSLIGKDNVRAFPIAVLLLANNALMYNILLTHSCEAYCVLNPQTLTYEPIYDPVVPKYTYYAVTQS